LSFPSLLLSASSPSTNGSTSPSYASPCAPMTAFPRSSTSREYLLLQGLKGYQILAIWAIQPMSTDRSNIIISVRPPTIVHMQFKPFTFFNYGMESIVSNLTPGRCQSLSKLEVKLDHGLPSIPCQESLL
jgi:hypothetical protein